ncbi:hypothetical protein [Spiroplasma endosymbiont of Amphimallon solstitiale]|uniref:hypothetical protein n=1 Tax=Spiroplasma endosymbiont of Amphimallon solstitiale TaxID=3066288 RepID=UPI00313CFE3A
MNINENKKCELRICKNKVWKDCINNSTKTIKYKNWPIPYLICDSCYHKLPKYLKQTAKIIEKDILIMNKTKKRRKRCVGCNELYEDNKINMLYHFKTELEAEQHNTKKYEDNYDIEKHLDYTKSYGYVCDWCRDD